MKTTGCKINELSIFSHMCGLPVSESEIIETFQSDLIEKVVCFSLGPEGTNIAQASRKWLRETSITRKAEVVLCDTPEDCLAMARNIKLEGDVVAIFWTCAVYSKESQFFFRNPDVFPFFIYEKMPLDEMQLSTRQDIFSAVQNGEIPSGWRIASHPSPQYLVEHLNREIILVDSNAAAAKHCSERNSEACITTEEARKIYNLRKLYSFGSPLMIFFGGVTQHGAMVIKTAFQSILEVKREVGVFFSSSIL